jgi:chloramphenicol-sensitive protein RarD
MNRGIAYAALAYALWGLFPIYFKLLQHVPAPEILAHRMAWSLAVCLLILAVTRNWGWLTQLARRPRVLAWFTCSAAIVTVNWGLYIWAINAGRVVDSSLGYFINPLVNVLIGVLILHERLRGAQWGAVGIAAAGVLWLTVAAGELPWIGLCLAASWGTYGLLRKTGELGSVEGLSVETTVLFPFALGFLGWLAAGGQDHFVAGDLQSRLWLAAAGPITAVPLLLFAAAARRVTMTMLGVLQYIAPTLQFLLGVLLYGEPFEARKAVGYVLIWIALALFTGEGLWRAWRPAAAPAR